ncbi:MAG: hypothetical protein JSS93_01255 [Bacteroidetes bacterium]|nr:hypothetical protein [Bacteroidota bacterium]
MTQDLQRRVAEHNAGKAKFTSAHRPWKLIYSEPLSPPKMINQKLNF